MSATQKYLFIGGPADGQWRGIPADAPAWQVVEFTYAGSGRHSWLRADSFPIRAQPITYRRGTIDANGEVFTVFIEQSLSVAQAFELLLAGYHPEHRS